MVLISFREERKMAQEFIFEDQIITEEDITDEILREECIKYLLERLSVSKYLRENITIAENERLAEWIKAADLDTATGLILSEAGDASARKGILKKAIMGVGKGAKAVGKGAVAGGKAVGKGAVAAGKAVGKGAAATGKLAWKHKYATAGIVAAGVAGTILYRKYLSKCAKQCKDAANKSDCMAKCKEAAKARAVAHQARA
jgi:hypothetical protein